MPTPEAAKRSATYTFNAASDACDDRQIVKQDVKIRAKQCPPIFGARSRRALLLGSVVAVI
jgi:hypothetical protein